MRKSWTHIELWRSNRTKCIGFRYAAAATVAMAVHFGYPLPLGRERGSVRRNAFGSNKSSRVESSRAEPIWRKCILQWLLMVVYLLTDDFQHMFMENNISFGSLKVATEKLWISNSFNFTEIVSISKYGIKVRNVTEWMKTK